jgi:hypothetical protein
MRYARFMAPTLTLCLLACSEGNNSDKPADAGGSSAVTTQISGGTLADASGGAPAEGGSLAAPTGGVSTQESAGGNAATGGASPLDTAIGTGGSIIVAGGSSALGGSSAGPTGGSTDNVLGSGGNLATGGLSAADTTAATGGTGSDGSESSCENFAILSSAKYVALGCPASSSDVSASILNQCKYAFSYVGCRDLVKSLISCAQAQPQTNWQCNGNSAEVKDGLCDVEKGMLAGCQATTALDGTLSCSTSGADACTACELTHCCSEMHNLYTNRATIEIQQCIFGEGNSMPGCITSSGFDTACATACYEAHPDGQADFSAIYSQTDSCPAINCAAEC